MAVQCWVSICLGILFLRGAFSKSIINGTSAENRLDTLEKRINVFEKQMENITDLLINFPLSKLKCVSYLLIISYLLG